MNETAIIRFLSDTFEDVEAVTADGNSFLFCGSERKMPFVTLVTNDLYDQASNLSRPGVFRLNIGIRKKTCLSIFDDADQNDFAALDRLMPHPVYAAQSWVCVLNPSDETFEKTVRPLLTEAYELSTGRQARRAK